MKSRTFCCNGAILKKDFLRGAPLWGVYLLVWLAAIPMTLLSQRGWRNAAEMQYLVLEAAVVSSHVVPFFYGLGAACLLFSYLYRSRNANFFAALPLRRESLFATKYLTGLLYLLLPNLAVAVVTVLLGAALGVNLTAQVLAWFAMSALGYVFYFSFAVLCAMAVGHLAALPLLYGVLNFTAIVVETIVRELLRLFVYGWYSTGNVLTFLSPLWYCMGGAHGPSAVADYNGAAEMIGCYLTGWKLVLILAAVGAAFALLAFWMYRKRRMESAGDVIAVRHLKPVFLYCFTAGCSLVFGWLLSAMIIDNRRGSHFLLVLICLLAGAVLGYFGGEMLLHKSLRVFRKRNWANCAVACAVIAAVLCCCRFDVFGYSSYVPEAEEVEAVSLDYGEAYSEDPRFVARAAAFHQAILEQRSQTEQLLQSESRGRTVYLRYRLRNGRLVGRRYTLPVTEAALEDSESLLRQYEDLYNDPDYIVLRYLPAGYAKADIRRGYVTYYNSSGEEIEIYLSASQAYELLKTAVEPDLRETSMGVTRETRYDYDGVPDTIAVAYDVTIRIEFQERFQGSRWIYPTSDATRIIQALTGLGVPEEAFQS